MAHWPLVTTTAGSETTLFRYLTHSDPLFLICSRLMGFASILKVFVDVLNAKLFADSRLNSGFAAPCQVETNLRKPNPTQQSIRELLKQTLIPDHKITKSTNWCLLMPVLPKTIKNSRVGKLLYFLWSTPSKSVQQLQQPKINGGLKIQMCIIHIFIMYMQHT